MNPMELWSLREKGLSGRCIKTQGANFWSKRNSPALRKSKTYDAQEKFSTKPFITSEQSLHEFACTALPKVFKESTVDLGRVNKVFAAQWLNPDSVILGTKCNRLLVVDLNRKPRCGHKRNWRKSRENGKNSGDPLRRKRDHDGRLVAASHVASAEDGDSSAPAMLAPPRYRKSPKNSIKWIPSLNSSAETKWDPEVGSPSSGVHTIKINPSGTLLATGALVPSDVAVYSLPDFKPVAVGEGHTDWLFDVEWLDDEFLISGSRDSSLALWKFRDDEYRISCAHVPLVKPPRSAIQWHLSQHYNRSNLPQAHQPYDRPQNGVPEYPQICLDPSWEIVELKRQHPAIEPLQIVKIRKFDKIRALSCNHKQKSVIAVSLNSYLSMTDLQTMRQRHMKKLSEMFSECVCLCHSPDENLLAIGSRSHFAFFDTHSLREVMDVRLPLSGETSMFEHVVPSGVRSISWRGPLVTVGTGNGHLLFYDVRNCSFLECTGYGCRSNHKIKISPGFSTPDEDELFPWPTAVYTHCYDSSGVRLFAAGGPIAATRHGNYAGVWQ